MSSYAAPDPARSRTALYFAAAVVILWIDLRNYLPENFFPEPLRSFLGAMGSAESVYGVVAAVVNVYTWFPLAGSLLNNPGAGESGGDENPIKHNPLIPLSYKLFIDGFLIVVALIIAHLSPTGSKAVLSMIFGYGATLMLWAIMLPIFLRRSERRTP